MYRKPDLPSWPELAKSIARSYVEGQKLLADAIAEGDPVLIRQTRKAVTETKKLMDKYQITIVSR